MKKIDIRSKEGRQTREELKLYAVMFCFLFFKQTAKSNFTEESLVIIGVKPRQRLSAIIKKWARDEVASFLRVHPNGYAEFVGVNEIARIYDPLEVGCEILFRWETKRNMVRYKRTMLSAADIDAYRKRTSRQPQD